ncbi:MAG: pyridoxal-phosphate dependent enzyme, partial [Pseudomonadales bacterium]|nr:pyridoxal-phosphate dependent enzyme [Pseudomonadales bacterium]
MKIAFEDVQAAYSRIGSSVVRTALDHSGNLSEMLGQDVYLKYENHQFTGSFKERGALNRLLLFQQEGRLGNGVIAVSAGNHAQAVAYHASRLGIHATIVMPRFTPNTKVERTRGFGAEVVLTGINFAEAVADAERIGVERGLVQLHPYDDPAVIAGQGTLAMEMLEQEPDLGTIVTAVGGGGLLSG